MTTLFVRRFVAAGAGLAAAATLTVAAPSASAVTPPYAVTASRVAAAAGWLATQFEDATGLPHPDGTHFNYSRQFGPNYGENADVIFGLAAAGTARGRVAVALNYLARHANGYADFGDKTGFGPADGAIGKMALAAIVAGANPQRFGGHALLTRLKRDECRAPGTQCAARGAGRNVLSTAAEAFVILAEARGPARFAPSPAALRYFLSLQCRNGGFTVGNRACGAGAADVDATAYALMALTTVGGHPLATRRAVRWLLSQRKNGRYWVAAVSGGGPDVNSTGLAVAALERRGIDLSRSRHWLLAQQVPAGRLGAGALRYAGTFQPTSAAATSPSVLATAQALTGLSPTGSLARVSAARAARTIALFAPAESLSARRVPSRSVVTATGKGFVAGERVAVVLNGRVRFPAAVGTAGPGGLVRVRFRAPARAASYAVTLRGRASGLAVTRRLTVTR